MDLTLAGVARTYRPNDDQLGTFNLDFAALDGEVGIGQIPLPDRAGTLQVLDGRACQVNEESTRLTDGFLIDMDNDRGPEPAAVAKVRTISVQDANVLLSGFRYIGTRPAETDVQRILSALAAPRFAGWDTSWVLNTNTVPMPKKKYDSDGGWTSELIPDLVETTGKTVFVHDKAAGGRCVHYHSLLTGHTSGLTISDVIGDFDQVTVWEPWAPTRKRTGIDITNDVRGRDQTGRVSFQRDPTSIADHDADGLEHETYVDFQADSQADLDRKTAVYLNSHKDEYYTYTCQIGPLDEDALALIRVGDLIPVTSSVMELTNSTERIAHMTLHPAIGNGKPIGGEWMAELELANPIDRKGTRSSGKPAPPKTDTTNPGLPGPPFDPGDDDDPTLYPNCSPTTIVDTFNRVVPPDSWGSADNGMVWTGVRPHVSSTSTAEVNGSVGILTTDVAFGGYAERGVMPIPQSIPSGGMDIRFRASLPYDGSEFTTGATPWDVGNVIGFTMQRGSGGSLFGAALRVQRDSTIGYYMRIVLRMFNAGTGELWDAVVNTAGSGSPIFTPGSFDCHLHLGPTLAQCFFTAAGMATAGFTLSSGIGDNTVDLGPYTDIELSGGATVIGIGSVSPDPFPIFTFDDLQMPGCLPATPGAGQRVHEIHVGDGTDSGFTNHPYAPGSLHIKVNSLDWDGVLHETNPATGEYSLDYTTVTDDTIELDYQGTGAGGTPGGTDPGSGTSPGPPSSIPVPTPPAAPAGTPLQDLITAASPGATVVVPLATYHEAITINKALTLDLNGSVITGDHVRSTWCTVTHDDVTIKNGWMVDALPDAASASKSQTGSLVCNGSDRLTLSGMRLSRGRDMDLLLWSSADSQLLGCSFNDGPRSGATFGAGSGVPGLRITDCQFNHNRTNPTYSVGFEGGAYKIGNSASTDIIITRTECSYNNGVGHWIDEHPSDVHLVDCWGHHNAYSTFMYEISTDGEISNCRSWESGWGNADGNNPGGGGWGWGAGFLVSSAGNVLVHDCISSFDAAGITRVNQGDRANRENTVDLIGSGNVIVGASGRRISSWHQDGSTHQVLFTDVSNEETGLRYWSAGGPIFAWNGDISAAAFAATRGGTGMTLLTTAAKDAILTAADMPTGRS